MPATSTTTLRITVRGAIAKAASANWRLRDERRGGEGGHHAGHVIGDDVAPDTLHEDIGSADLDDFVVAVDRGRVRDGPRPVRHTEHVQLVVAVMRVVVAVAERDGAKDAVLLER